MVPLNPCRTDETIGRPIAWYTSLVLAFSEKTLSYVKKPKPGFRSGSGLPSGPVKVMELWAGKHRHNARWPWSFSLLLMGRARMATQMPSSLPAEPEPPMAEDDMALFGAWWAFACFAAESAFFGLVG